MTSIVSTERSEPDRHAAMVEAMAEVRPARSAEFPLETVLLTVGGLCLPAGLVAIIAGWYGVAHTGHIYEQNSYLMSGGLFGLGLVFVGGFLYFGYWMTRHIHATNTAAEQTLRAISRLEEQLVAVAAATAASAAAANGSGSGSGTSRRRAATSGAVTVVATERGTLLHRPTCAVVANKARVRAIDPNTPGYTPCRICNPFD